MNQYILLTAHETNPEIAEQTGRKFSPILVKLDTVKHWTDIKIGTVLSIWIGTGYVSINIKEKYDEVKDDTSRVTSLNCSGWLIEDGSHPRFTNVPDDCAIERFTTGFQVLSQKFNELTK